MLFEYFFEKINPFYIRKMCCSVVNILNLSVLIVVWIENENIQI